MTRITPAAPDPTDTLPMNTRNAFTIEQVQAALTAAELNWQSATWQTAGMWKKTVHNLRDRLGFMEFHARMRK